MCSVERNAFEGGTKGGGIAMGTAWNPKQVVESKIGNNSNFGKTLEFQPLWYEIEHLGLCRFYHLTFWSGYKTLYRVFGSDLCLIGRVACVFVRQLIASNESLQLFWSLILTLENCRKYCVY